MLSLKKRIIIVCGHYGSGKTEFAVNLALAFAAHKKPVCLVDFDIVNPYFCSREQETLLTAAGAELIAPSSSCRTADVPALPAEISRIFCDDSLTAIIDSGGDPVGARVLSRYMPQLTACGYEMLMVLNANRPQTADSSSALMLLENICEVSRLKISGIVNNTHLCELTSPEDILRGYLAAKELCTLTGLPLICSTVPKISSMSGKELKGVGGELFCIDILMKKPWE